jgi:Tfp pilus assembly protein PilZ
MRQRTAQKKYFPMEQRKEHRFSKQLYVQLSTETKVFWGVLNDFSKNGLFVKCNQDFPIGAVIDIEIFMSDKSTSVLKGIVRRKIDMPESNRKHGLGIELIEKDAPYQQYVKFHSEKIKTPLNTSELNI